MLTSPFHFRASFGLRFLRIISGMRRTVRPIGLNDFWSKSRSTGKQSYALSRRMSPARMPEIAALTILSATSCPKRRAANASIVVRSSLPRALRNSPRAARSRPPKLSSGRTHELDQPGRHRVQPAMAVDVAVLGLITCRNHLDAVGDAVQHFLEGRIAHHDVERPFFEQESVAVLRFDGAADAGAGFDQPDVHAHPLQMPADGESADAAADDKQPAAC